MESCMVQRNLKGGFPEEIMVKKTHKRWQVSKHRVKRKKIPRNIKESVVKLKWQFGRNWRVLSHKWLCSVQFSHSVMSDSLQSHWTAACQASRSIINSWSLLRLMSIELVMPSSHLILCRPLALLPPIPPSIRVFSNESTLCIRWPEYWSFSLSISPSNEHPGLVSFRMDWLDLLAVQGTLKSLLQHHSSKASILQCSAFFIVQLWHPYMTTGKTNSLD